MRFSYTLVANDFAHADFLEADFSKTYKKVQCKDWMILNLKSLNQRDYIELAQGTIFMEQNMRFGLILTDFGSLTRNIHTFMCLDKSGHFWQC